MKIFNQKNERKQNIFGTEDSSNEEMIWKKDTFPGKLNDILDNLNYIFKEKSLLGLMKITDSQEIPKLANLLYNELEIFLSTHQKF